MSESISTNVTGISEKSEKTVKQFGMKRFQPQNTFQHDLHKIKDLVNTYTDLQKYE